MKNNRLVYSWKISWSLSILASTAKLLLRFENSTEDVCSSGRPCYFGWVRRSKFRTTSVSADALADPKKAK